MVSNMVVITRRAQTKLEVVVIWRFDWGWRICFQDGALMWLMAGGLNSRPHEEHVGMLKNLCDMAPSFLYGE